MYLLRCKWISLHEMLCDEVIGSINSSLLCNLFYIVIGLHGQVSKVVSTLPASISHAYLM